jgi:chromosome segregation ATPase
MFSFIKLELMNWDLWDHVTFPMNEQVVVVSGPNGSGKTTLLDAIRVLLGSRTLSTSRKLGGYLRNEVRVAVIKAEVSNPLRRGHGRRPFTRKGIFEDTATVACVLTSKNGSWQRSYHILPGDASLETIRAQPRGMGPEEYANELRAAGLPRTLLKILALEQGETHALCRRSPAQLLEYVLEMQGDKAVLDMYDVARENYAASRSEHSAQEERSREAERQLELTARDAQSFEDYRAIQQEIIDIETRRLPASRWHRLQYLGSQVGAELSVAKETVAQFDTKHADRIARIDQLERDVDQLEKAVVAKKTERVTLLKEKEGVDGRSRELRVRLKQLRTLQKAAEAAPEGDIEALQATVRSAMLAEADAERRVSAAREERQQLQAEQSGLGEGKRVRLPSHVRDIRQVLRSSGIEHALLCEVIDIKAPKWQKAVESVLGRDRFTVLVESKDALKARELASKSRYSAYVATLETAVHMEAPQKSALAVVELAEPRIPMWIKRRLADVTLVDSIKAGFSRTKDGPTITSDGYRQDERGGVYVGVDELYCGGNAQKAAVGRISEKLSALKDVENDAEDARRSAVRRRAVAQSDLDAMAAVTRWEEVKAELPQLVQDDESASSEKAKRASQIMDVLSESEELTRELAERRAELRQLKLDNSTVDEVKRSHLVKLHELTNRLRGYEKEAEELLPDVAEELRTEAAGTLIESAAELRGRLAVLREHETNYEGIRDEGILEVLERQRSHLDEQLSLLKRREVELKNGEQELGRARTSYVRVADATIGRYSLALHDLAAKAGMDVDVRRPRLSNDDEVIRKAGLDVRLGFDGKRPIMISDPKLSGGQKVLASILLLVALTYEGENEGGGFFILDEPFAHLSVERIEDVTRFIGQTRSQFLLTTPTTHNFAVFNAARMLLTLRKKKPEMEAAPAPMYVRR